MRCTEVATTLTALTAMASDNLDDIIKKNTPRLRSFVRSRVSNQHDADDIVQDTLYQLVRTITIMDNPVGHVTAWLYKVARNLVINHGKKRREEEMPHIARDDGEDSFMTDISELLVASDDDSPDMQMLRAMVWDELHKALNELPPEQREAIELTEIKGLTVKQAAEVTGVPVGTFLSRKHYAVLHIRRRLRDLYDELI